MTNRSKQILAILLILLVITPVFTHAQFVKILPDCGTATKECGFTDLIQMIKNIITDLIYFSIPVSAAVFAYAGFILMTTGVADKKSDAKKMIQKVFVGLVIILSAWLVTTTLTKVLIKPGVGIDLIGS